MTTARYVLLEHTWRGVHWDLMFEDAARGVLRTWRLATRPDDGLDVEARKLPDHRLVYLDYEGPVAGDRGFVRRVDAGAFAMVAESESEFRARLKGGQLAGLIALRRTDSGPDSSGWTCLFRRGKRD